jgi:hypothetical protein
MRKISRAAGSGAARCRRPETTPCPRRRRPGSGTGNRFVVDRVTDVALAYDGLSPDGPFGVAAALAYLGRADDMYEMLDLAERKALEHIRVDPVFDPYRGSARFEALLEAAGYAS